jgi:hypothetical protein
MIRTKHLFIVFITIAITIGVVGFLFHPKIADAPKPQQEIIFGTPKDSYGVIFHENNEWSTKRSAFIAKVRSVLLRDLNGEATKKEETIQKNEATDTVPTPTPYQNTIATTTTL